MGKEEPHTVVSDLHWSPSVHFFFFHAKCFCIVRRTLRGERSPGSDMMDDVWFLPS